jgi:hypothetical protein
MRRSRKSAAKRRTGAQASPRSKALRHFGQRDSEPSSQPHHEHVRMRDRPRFDEMGAFGLNPRGSEPVAQQN